MQGFGVADPPYLTDQERRDYYTLWRASGGRITPSRARSQMEAWEVELLLTGLHEEGFGVNSPASNALAQHDPDVTPEWVASLPAN